MKIDSPNAIGTSTGFGIPTGGTANQILVKTGSTNYDTAWVSVINDQSSSNYIDIGNVRYQWGTDSQTAGARNVVFPAAFKDTTYTFTANSVASDSSSRTVNLGTFSTTQILVRVTTAGGASTSPIRWMAIGLKP